MNFFDVRKRVSPEFPGNVLTVSVITTIPENFFYARFSQVFLLVDEIDLPII